MMARLNREKSELMTRILDNPHCRWMKKTREVMENYNIGEDDLNGTAIEAKNAIHFVVYLKFYKKMKMAQEERSKLKHFLEGKIEWRPEESAQYMKQLTRKQASTIFKARTRMLKVKCNYKNGYRDHACRACQKTPETQKHVLNECEIIKSNITRKKIIM